ncbi:MAG: hypothetical protein R6V01_00715 [Thermoplasmatota archaeon]
MIEGFPVIDHLVYLPQALGRGGYLIEEKSCGLLKGKGVPFDGS